ncbi:MarR family transcriptional regulator [Pseudohalioglobus sediminis]|uniref:MarR family transcriptional regulator n=1 Tax=Pseudohalioglobus sediminis TaxID=2606449 RepID=A0A5B0X3W5_9GAMM|nr:MarR family transcriptional regulator [Pseudohalioglobus sediminis]KAA1194014.1 MarR family transcriptional regulator [Pseudohalioglobus sediminis]
MAETPAWQGVLVSLRRIIRATDMQSRRMVKDCGLTIPQLVVLRAIESQGDVTTRRIADHVSLSQATVTTILDRLQSRLLVERIRNEQDKRVVNARLTEAGRKTLAASPTLLHETFIERFESLGKKEQQSILDALEKVAAMMDADKIEAAPLLDVQKPI